MVSINLRTKGVLEEYQEKVKCEVEYKDNVIFRMLWCEVQKREDKSYKKMIDQKKNSTKTWESLDGG